ncbi:MAG: hypothetical protein U0599_30700 [Vicinamibacteria bacterium]
MSSVEALEAHHHLALRRPRSGEPDVARQLREEGHRLVFLLNGLVRGSRLYDLDNAALAGPAEELAAVLSGHLDRIGAVAVSAVESEIYVNDVRLRVRPAQHVAIEQLAAELARHEAGGLVFHHALRADALRRVAHALAAPATSPRLESLRAQVAEAGDVEVTGRLRHRTGPEDDGPPAGETRILEALAAAAGSARARAAAGWMPSPLPLRRAVIPLVDLLRTDPGRAALAPFSGGPGEERHAVSTCQLALLVGRTLGLGDAALADLGVAALVHDVGVPRAADAPGARGLAGARVLLRQRGFGDAQVRRLKAVLELERDYDSAGGAPSPFARILRVAHEYDLLTAPREDAPGRLAPPAALARLWAARGTRLDPDVVAALARELGAFPPGSLLRLASGEWAVAVRAGEGRARWRRPVVRIVRSAQGVVRPGELVDLGAGDGPSEDPGVIEPLHLAAATAAACRDALADAGGRAAGHPPSAAR